MAGLLSGIGKGLKGLFGGDFSDRAARAMAFVNDDYEGAARISQNMRRNQMEQRNQAALSKALDGMNLTPEQRELLGSNPDLAQKHILKSWEPQTPEYAYTQDNAGNMWQYDKRTGKFADQPSFIDKAPRQYLQDGQLINVPNPYLNGGIPDAPVGELTPYNDPGIPTGNPLANAPRLNAQQRGQILGNAMGAKTITQQEAARVRQSLGPNGQAAFEKWLRDNNIQIGGF